MEAPICLIEKLQDGRLQVNAEAIEILSKIKQPLAVVATVGMYRTGKSYMMNKLAGFEKGFQLGATVQGKTKGIWMWCVPHPRLKEHTLVLLDTEGLGDVQKGNKKNDTNIFCLSVLLSSVLVYNSIRTIDEDAVEKLRFVGELAELIKVRSGDNEDNECQFSRHFPSFIWLVRDFTLNLEMDGKEITEDEYLENALLPGECQLTAIVSAEETEETSMRIHSQHAIRMYFNTRKCFVFDSPTGDKNILQRMDEVSVEDLSSIFVEQCQRFCEYIYKNAEVKYLDDITPVSGEILGQLVYKYTEALSSSGIVCMEDTVIRISEEQNKAAVQEATEYYEKRMKERVHFPTETLEEFVEISAKCEEEALEIFMKRSFRDSELNFHKQYMRNIEEKKKHFSNMNETESRNYCDQLIKKHSGDLEEALKQSLYSKPGGYKKFQEDIKLIQQRYNSEPRKGVEVGISNTYLKAILQKIPFGDTDITSMTVTCSSGLRVSVVLYPKGVFEHPKCIGVLYEGVVREEDM
uniref:GB1/RHD3-type G domain-containing protein n=1 Tax=Pyxicephalus adspersus TaxID=30357 RepID=A0AAV2ZXH5_PYXAD|nr:TPA: hypothetical protein GDO54_014848 [Pyxicephalus adspersus]